MGRCFLAARRGEHLTLKFIKIILIPTQRSMTSRVTVLWLIRHYGICIHRSVNGGDSGFSFFSRRDLHIRGSFDWWLLLVARVARRKRLTMARIHYGFQHKVGRWIIVYLAFLIKIKWQWNNIENIPLQQTRESNYVLAVRVQFIS